MECPFCDQFVRATPEAIHDHLLMRCGEKDRWRREEVAFPGATIVTINPLCPCGYEGMTPRNNVKHGLFHHILEACKEFGAENFFTSHLVLSHRKT